MLQEIKKKKSNSFIIDTKSAGEKIVQVSEFTVSSQVHVTNYVKYNPLTRVLLNPPHSPLGKEFLFMTKPFFFKLKSFHNNTCNTFFPTFSFLNLLSVLLSLFFHSSISLTVFATHFSALFLFVIFYQSFSTSPLLLGFPRPFPQPIKQGEAGAIGDNRVREKFFAGPQIKDQFSGFKRR